MQHYLGGRAKTGWLWICLYLYIYRAGTDHGYQNNVSLWGDMSIHRLLFQWAITIKNPTKHVGLVQSGPRHHLIEN
jgi:hypothetical protein